MTISTDQARELRTEFLHAWLATEHRIHPSMRIKHEDQLMSTLVALSLAAGDVRSYDQIAMEASLEVRRIRESMDNVIPLPVALGQFEQRRKQRVDEYVMVLQFTYRNASLGLDPYDQADVDEVFFREDADALTDIVRQAHEHNEIDINVYVRGSDD